MTYAPNEDEMRAAYDEQDRLRADLATARSHPLRARGWFSEGRR